MREILIATGNSGKKKEMLSFFREINNITFLSLKDFPKIEEPEENGKTFEENAMIKAKYFANKFQITTLGEDSGLILSAFPEKFGLRTRREIEAKNDVEWITKFLKLLNEVTDRSATFYSAMAFFDPKTKTEQTFLGQTSGIITDFPRTALEKGIPVSSVFVPEGEEDVFSAMLRKKKNEISHRGKSANLMKKFLIN
jgi:XTP/dITP diphosphohydrolase